MRRRDWDPRLAAYLRDAEKRPHAYGKHDCLLFCAGAVKALTGKDFGRGHRGKYRSAATASRYLRKLGFDSPAAMIGSLLPEKPVLKAGRGDIVLSDGEPGVCIGGQAAFVGVEEGREGIVLKPRSAWQRAWSVG